MISVSVDNKNQLNEVLGIKKVGEVIINRDSFNDFDIKDLIIDIKNKQKKATLMLETISRLCQNDNDEKLNKLLNIDGIDSIVVKNINSFYYILNNIHRKLSITFDYNMNIYNNYSKQYYKDLCKANDIDCKFVAPVELNFHELRELNFDYIVVYGYLPLMVTKNCIFKNTGGCKHNQYDTIYDRLNKGLRFRSYCNFCYNKIFNSVPLDVRDNKFVYDNEINCRYDFTFEDASLIKPIIFNEYEISDRTKGHYIKTVI